MSSVSLNDLSFSIIKSSSFNVIWSTDSLTAPSMSKNPEEGTIISLFSSDHSGEVNIITISSSTSIPSSTVVVIICYFFIKWE